MQLEQLPWELEERILTLIPTKCLARFRSVCKRWNSLSNERRFINNHLARARPQFILIARSKICSVEVNLDVPSIEVHSHNLPSYIPGYNGFFMTVECCDGLVVYATMNGIGICNPLLRQIRWIKSKVNYRYNGVGYDNSRPENHYKIFESFPYSDTTVKASITEFVSDAWISKPYEFAYDWDFMSSYSVSLNGALYWVAFHMASHDQFIQSFDFSTEKFEPYCLLPNKKCDPSNARSLAVFS
ncbi:unnamed protein product [Arabidopsis thaliana]|uniref:F-box domain-containing protein n=1 Tax=Arabidopsis thaliana TaxID=3702 RepID=A0A5S9XN19_ARATH|nr:unnamed protein product [Arabidopsis thaliana]